MTADVHTLTGAYALDALPEDERRDFERHLADCEACRREVEEFRATAAHLASAGHEEPPAGLKERVMAEVDTIRQDPPPTVVEMPKRPMTQRLLTVAAVILAIAAIGLGVTVAGLNDRVEELETASAQMAEIMAAPDAETVALETEVGGVAQFVYSRSQGEAVFLAKGLPTLSEDEVYELWLIGADGPVPAGLFRPGERGATSQLLAGGVGSAQAVAVTVEPAGGSDQPTTEPIVVLEVPTA
ncbi:MAG: anti-sigma factor [Nitriliruptorales bacterium]|nr:anti-sigma factor [Nitriliruptorales bacterium]